MEYIQFIVTIIIILLIFFFAESQRKKQDQELKKMQSEIKKDDKIITYSGLSGIVEEVLEDRVILKTYPNMMEISIEKWAIAGLDDRDNK
ncbi:MAG: preprotein translocase subunit YajC [Clostridia bacterium]